MLAQQVLLESVFLWVLTIEIAKLSHFFCVAGCDPYSGVLLLFAAEHSIADPGFAVWRMCSSMLLQSIPSGKGVYPELLSGISKLDCGEEYCNRWSYSSADLEFRLHVRRTLDGGC